MADALESLPSPTKVRATPMSVVADPSHPSAQTALRDWLVTESREIDEPSDFLSAFAEKLLAAGLPLDRIGTAIEILHTDYAGVGQVWLRGEGIMKRYFPFGPVSEAAYQSSPFAWVHRERGWLRFRLDETPDDRFSVVPELRAAGIVDYICVPMFFSNGDENGLSFATRDPNGFQPEHVALLEDIMPTLALALELRATQVRFDNILRFYVGDEPHRQIMSGAVRRGQVARIRSAILVADMRSYTEFTYGLELEEVADLLNTFFDCFVPSIHAEGGEVLKYMGDGLLAIFRDPSDDVGSAAISALAAAEKGLAALDALDREARFPFPLKAGIGLHHGDAAYGNVGSGQRLDFTVVGRDVNVASRLAELNKPLSEPLLMSKAFAEQIFLETEALGAFAVHGLPEPLYVHRPKLLRSVS